MYMLFGSLLNVLLNERFRRRVLANVLNIVVKLCD